MSDSNMIVVLAKADGTKETIHVEDHPSLEQMNKWVGGHIERVRVRYMGRVCDMIVDEEGLLKGKPTNEFATRLYTDACRGANTTPIVGDVVIFTNFNLR